MSILLDELPRDVEADARERIGDLFDLFDLQWGDEDVTRFLETVGEFALMEREWGR